jgi:hypothetical protein
VCLPSTRLCPSCCRSHTWTLTGASSSSHQAAQQQAARQQQQQQHLTASSTPAAAAAAAAVRQPHRRAAAGCATSCSTPRATLVRCSRPRAPCCWCPARWRPWRAWLRSCSRGCRPAACGTLRAATWCRATTCWRWLWAAAPEGGCCR